jgi:hypothetical protein
VPDTFAPFQKEIWIFLADFHESLEYQISRKSVQWKQRCCVRRDGRTDMTKVIGAARYYANAPNESKIVACLRGSQWTTKQILLQYLLSCDSVHMLCAVHRNSKSAVE